MFLHSYKLLTGPYPDRSGDPYHTAFKTASAAHPGASPHMNNDARPCRGRRTGATPARRDAIAIAIGNPAGYVGIIAPGVGPRSYPSGTTARPSVGASAANGSRHTTWPDAHRRACDT